MSVPGPILVARDPDVASGGRPSAAEEIARHLAPGFADVITVEVREPGAPEPAILDRAREMGAGMIVVPAGRCRWAGRWEPLDDPGRRLARRTDRPLLLVPDDARWSSPPVFGVATDFSDPSRRATEWVLDLADRIGGSLRLLHAPETPGLPENPPPYLTSDWLRSAVRDRAARHLEALADRLQAKAGVEVRAVLAEPGEPAEGLVASASNEGLCLLALGSLGLGPAGDRLLGPTAEDIVFLHDGCTLVVPGPSEAPSAAGTNHEAAETAGIEPGAGAA